MTQLKFTNRPIAGMDNYFNEFFNLPSAWVNPSADITGLPAANVYETKYGYQLELNVPGRNKEDFNINLEKDLLTVSFEAKKENKPEGITTVRREFSVKSFKRSFSLDEKIDVTNIQAKYENGILRIELPKKEEVKQEPKQITIS
jgi:HSP20 family protein